MKTKLSIFLLALLFTACGSPSGGSSRGSTKWAVTCYENDYTTYDKTIDGDVYFLEGGLQVRELDSKGNTVKQIKLLGSCVAETK